MPAMAKRSGRVVIGVFGMAVLVVGGVVLAVGMQKGGFLTLTDVGELPELADVQARLMPLDLCEIEYAGRGKLGQRTRFDHLRTSPCSGDGYEGMSVAVPEDWGRKNVGYQLSRRGPGERFKVLVEKDEVPFPDLLGALADHVPVLVERYTTQLAEQRTASAAHDAQLSQQRADEAARKAGAAGSYPTK